jgi:prepilin-type processing-associated H-X9-DG protein
VWNPYVNFGHGSVVFSMKDSSLQPYLKSTQIWLCPSDTDASRSGDSYASNGCTYSDQSNGRRPSKSLAAFEETSRWMLLGEEASTAKPLTDSTDDGFYSLPSGNDFSTRHLDGSNFAFVDGHVKFLRPDRARADGIAIGGARAVTLTDSCS